MGDGTVEIRHPFAVPLNRTHPRGLARIICARFHSTGTVRKFAFERPMFRAFSRKFDRMMRERTTNHNRTIFVCDRNSRTRPAGAVKPKNPQLNAVLDETFLRLNRCPSGKHTASMSRSWTTFPPASPYWTRRQRRSPFPGGPKTMASSNRRDHSFQMMLHGYDHSSLLTHLDAKCLPAKYGGLMDIETDQGSELWKLLCYYEDNYRGACIIYTKGPERLTDAILNGRSVCFSDERVRLQEEEINHESR